MTVWVIHPPARRDGAIADIQPAAKWGEIRLIHRLTQYVTEDDIVGDGLSDQHMQRLIAASQEFNPMTDYLVMAGDQLQMQQFGLLLAQRYPKGYWVLRWNIKDRDYYAVRMVPATVPVTLKRHEELTQQFQREGMTREDASRKAFWLVKTNPMGRAPVTEEM